MTASVATKPIVTTLKRSKDRKVTNYVHMTKTGNATVGIANTFGLPSGKAFSCSDATEFCESICYAGKLEKIYKGTREVLLHNWELLKDATVDQMVELLSGMIDDFIKDCDKRGAEKLFRIHWDGDFFSAFYVVAWSQVIRKYSEVQFWAYTRVPTAAMFLDAQKLSNLSLYFSGDRDNVDIARHLESRGILVAYVEETFEQGKAEFPKAVRCPENNKAIPLISEKGSACAACGLCIKGRRSVLFSTTKK